MKKALLLILFSWGYQQVSAQKISDEFYKLSIQRPVLVQGEYGKKANGNYQDPQFRAMADSLREVQSSLNYLTLKKLFRDYKIKTGIDPDTSENLNILITQQHLSWKIFIWNSSDTLYSQFIARFMLSKEKSIDAHLLPISEKDPDNYTRKLMAFIGNASKNEIIATIIDKRYGLVLDGPRHELYVFKRQEGVLQASKFLFGYAFPK